MIAYDQNNIFAKILKGELPCTKVYEDQYTLAFLDLQPVNEGHTLVIPKEECSSVNDLSPQSLAQVIQTGQKIGRMLRESSLPCEGVNFWFSDGASAGQEVFHVHLHVVPRYKGDGFHFAHGPNNRVIQTPSQLAETLRKLQRAL